MGKLPKFKNSIMLFPIPGKYNQYFVNMSYSQSQKPEKYFII